MSHTPGPWFVDENGPRWAVNTPGYPDSGKHIAMVNYYPVTITATESYSNARLIAAAPDLLEALADIEWIDDRYDTFCPSCGYTKQDGHAEDCRLAAALAKVRGEEAR